MHLFTIMDLVLVFCLLTAVALAQDVIKDRIFKFEEADTNHDHILSKVELQRGFDVSIHSGCIFVGWSDKISRIVVQIVVFFI